MSAGERTDRRWRIAISLIAAYALLVLSIVGTVVLRSMKTPAQRAVIEMGLSLNLIWCIAGGLLMLRFRDAVRRGIRSIPLPWQAIFILFCTFLALMEEVVTVTLTNLAPLFGVKVGEAYITASANYLDVVTRHSVVVFVPMFACWAWMLSRYDFRPAAVFLLYGITGNLAEVSFGGPGHLLAGFWIFVYGLMIYLPAYSVPENRTVKPPRWQHGVMAVFLPFLWWIPVAALLQLFPQHPAIHFPPIK